MWSTSVRKGRGDSGKRPGPTVHDDLVRRNFTAARPDAVWLTDVTEYPTGKGQLYCCAIKDVFSNRIVGDSVDDRTTAQLAAVGLDGSMGRVASAGDNAAMESFLPCSKKRARPAPVGGPL